jgi:hypothetical protein
MEDISMYKINTLILSSLTSWSFPDRTLLLSLGSSHG